MRSEELGSTREWRRTRKAESSRWGKYKLDDDDRELIKKHDIRTREDTHKLLSSQYWSTINQILASKSVTKKTLLPASYELDTVNWIQVLFDYLVSPGAAPELDRELQLCVPETVIIRNRRATALMRSHPNDSQSLDKMAVASMLEPSHLFDTIMAAARKLNPVLSPSSVVAYLVAATFNEQKGWTPVVEYMTEEILKAYLKTRLILEDREAILQVFVPPAGACNTLIRAWWSPYSLKLEQRVNLNDVSDGHKAPHTRCATFDGPDHYSEMRGIPGMDLREELSDTIDLLVARVTRQLPASKTIRRGLFYFKLGKDGKVFFLFTASLSIANPQPTGSQGAAVPSPSVKSKAPAVLRPPTPACVTSSWFTPQGTGDDLRQEQGTTKGSGSYQNWARKRAEVRGRQSATEFVLGEACPCCVNSAKTTDMLAVSFTSVLRRLSPVIYKAVMDEAALVRQASLSDDAWAQYLHASKATEVVYYGEDRDTKFPRHMSAGPLDGTRGAGLDRSVKYGDKSALQAQRAKVEAKCIRFLRWLSLAYRSSASSSSSADHAMGRVGGGEHGSQGPRGEGRGGQGGSVRGGESEAMQALTPEVLRELVLFVATNLGSFQVQRGRGGREGERGG